MRIVKVQFKSKFNNEYVGTEYSYYDEDGNLEVGEEVEVPTRFGNSTAKVTKVDIAEEEVVTFKDFMKSIKRKEENKEDNNGISNIKS